MDTHNLLFEIAAILLLARVLAEMAARLRIPSIFGELCAGILLGPTVLGWINPHDTLKLLAEIGIILLLFEVGLETDIARLAKAGQHAVVVALGGFILPFVLGSVVCFYVFNMSILVSLFIGGTLTATSIGFTVRILADVGRRQSREGHIVLGAAVIDDLLGIFLLAVLYEFSTSGNVSLYNSGKIIIFVAAFFLLAPVVAKLLIPLIMHFHKRERVPGLIPIVLISLVMIFAALAHSLGAPHILGGFAAGIALSRRFFLPFGASLHSNPEMTRQVQQQMKPIIQVFTPIFFVMVGLSLDLRSIDWSSSFIWIFSLSITAIAIIGKLAGPWLIRESIPTRIAVGMAMVPRGEVGLIFAELGRTTEIFSPAVYAGMIIVITYTTLAAPLWIKLFYNRFGNYISNNH